VHVKKMAVLRKAGMALAATTMAATAAVLGAAAAEATPAPGFSAQGLSFPPGCAAGWLYGGDGTYVGVWASCGSGTGRAYQAVARCVDRTTGYVSYASGPWKNPGTGDSNAWCASNSRTTEGWINFPE
jgi:hypothetical protein